MHQPSLLKRKRTFTDDEDGENNPPILVVEGVSADDHNWANGLLSPESEPCEAYSDDTISSADESTAHPLRNQYPNKSWSAFRGRSRPMTPLAERLSPLPQLSWADHQQVWELMCHKNKISKSERDEDLFSKHPQIEPRMRAILLDWLIEVSEVYKLHRETYHLSIDFIDRYLSCRRDIPKGQLQLIGITCLFIASKVEEIYPPKLQEFAYVTDGACNDREILEKEIIILKALNWNLSPVTSNSWLTMYMQLCCDAPRRRCRYFAAIAQAGADTFVYPQYSGLTFIQTVQLVDLCTLDKGSLRYSYSVLAASALCHMTSRALALKVSGLGWEDIEQCVSWALPFALTVQEERASHVTFSVRQGSAAIENHYSSGLLKSVPHIVMDNSHNIQTHTVDLQMLEKAQNRSKTHFQTELSSPVSSASLPCVNPSILTPPASQKKPNEHHVAMAGTFT